MSRESGKTAFANRLPAGFSPGRRPASFLRRLPDALPLRPTASGIYWLLALLALLASAVNYGNNLIFALAFLLMAVWLQAGWNCRRHLRAIDWHAQAPAPVFAGEKLHLDGRASGGPAFASGIILAAGRQRGADILFDHRGEARLLCTPPAEQRGERRITGLALLSRWPLGLWQVRRPLPDLHALVYPRPAGDLPLPGGPPRSAHRQAASDDFQGLRAYAAGDSLRRINWRVFGRRDELVVNHFDGGQGGEALRLDWVDCRGDSEARLGQLTRWVLMAEQAGREYGLILPGQTLPPARGHVQREKCLGALARFRPEPSPDELP